MSGGSIAPRPSKDQIMEIVKFMEDHPDLGCGHLKGLDGREAANKLWTKLTRIVNDTPGPTRPMKSWMKFWIDKKAQVKAKVLSLKGDSNQLASNIEKKIWDLFIATVPKKPREKVKEESAHFDLDESFFESPPVEQSNGSSTMFQFDVADPETDDKQMVVMEKLVKVMNDQAAALTQLAHASLVSSQAMDRLAEAAHIQARATDRLAGSFETIGLASHDIRNSIVDIDNSLKRFYSISST